MSNRTHDTHVDENMLSRLVPFKCECRCQYQTMKNAYVDQ